MAFNDERPIGAATVASRTTEINMLAGRDDLAVLWDIRVDNAYKRQGVGQTLFDMAVNWSREQGLAQIKSNAKVIMSRPFIFTTNKAQSYLQLMNIPAIKSRVIHLKLDDNALKLIDNAYDQTLVMREADEALIDKSKKELSHSHNYRTMRDVGG